MTEDKLDPDCQGCWFDIVDNSIYTISCICLNYGFERPTFMKWLYEEQKPRKANREKVVRIMSQLMKMPRISRDRSFGYATPDQIEKLKSMGIGPDRNKILAQVEKQNKLEGKIA